MYVILVDEKKRGGKWDRDDFFRTGREEIAALLASVQQLAIEPSKNRALDFGCGLGRLTQALAEHFESCDGVDIAPSMVEQARQFNRFGDRVRYHANGANDLRLFDDNTFDLIYTNIVLQHMEPRFAKVYISEFFRVLKPGGLAVFQVPSELSPEFLKNRSRLRVKVGQALAPLLERVLHSGEEPPSLYMYPVPRTEVEQLIRNAGVELVHAAPDGASGPEWTAFRYYVRKPAVQG
jgi:ubiquinone/menaquinone biosynthesis C-methylase UbiE